MKMSKLPTSLVLVGIIFICICAGSASSMPLDVNEQINKFKDNSIHSMGYDKSPEWGVLEAGGETVYFPWHGSSLPGRPAILKPASRSPVREAIIMDANNSSAGLDDLLVINSVKERDVIERSSQNGDPEAGDPSNALSIDVGGGEGQGDEASDYDSESIEAGGPGFGRGDLKYAGNYLTVNVHDIKVTAVNSMPDGNAVATSNIIIEPVQTIVVPSEVHQKL